MITDTTIDAWKRWLSYSISKDNATLSGIPIQLRDSEEVKSYPGIYLAESGEDRISAGGVQDSNVFRVTIDTMLVTTPGDDEDDAASQASHSELRNALAGHVGNGSAQDWISGQIGLTCFDLLVSSPMTTNEDGYRVTTWKTTFTVC